MEKLFIVEEIASLVLDVAPLQRSRKLKEELKQWVVAALEIKSTQSLACVTNMIVLIVIKISLSHDHKFIRETLTRGIVSKCTTSICK